jgi:hypothetical protein
MPMAVKVYINNIEVKFSKVLLRDTKNDTFKACPQMCIEKDLAKKLHKHVKLVMYERDVFQRFRYLNSLNECFIYQVPYRLIKDCPAHKARDQRVKELGEEEDFGVQKVGQE